MADPIIGITLYDLDGNSYTGSVPTFVAYKSPNGTNRTQPTAGFNHATGSNLYYAIPTAADLEVGTAYIIDCGLSCSSRYAAGAVSLSGGFVAWALYDDTGSLKTGASCSFLEYRALGVSRTAPSIVEIGAGLYGFVATDGDIQARTQFDISSSATPGRLGGIVEYDVQSIITASIVPPSVSNVSPTAGSNIYSTSSLSFDVTDDSGLFRRIMIVASFTGSDGAVNWEVVHNGNSFGPKYDASSSRSAISLGYHYAIARDDGWPNSPTITPYAIDTSGSENP